MRTAHVASLLMILGSVACAGAGEPGDEAETTALAGAAESTAPAAATCLVPEVHPLAAGQGEVFAVSRTQIRRAETFFDWNMVIAVEATKKAWRISHGEDAGGHVTYVGRETGVAHGQPVSTISIVLDRVAEDPNVSSIKQVGLAGSLRIVTPGKADEVVKIVSGLACPN